MNWSCYGSGVALAVALLAIEVGLADDPRKPESSQPAKLPNSANVLARDILVAPGHTPEPVISPNGNQIAFVSSGSVFVCNVKSGPPKELVAVPDTTGAILSEPQYAEFRGNEIGLMRAIISDEFREHARHRIRRFQGFKWDRAGDAVLFGLDSPRAAQGDKAGLEIHRVTIDGTDSVLAIIPPMDAGYGIVDWEVVCNGNQILIERSRGNTVCYDIEAKRLRTLPFVNMTPALDGLSFLGVEAESNQLVMIDEQFNVTKRFGVHKPERSNGLGVKWSPDKQFLLWRVQVGFDHYSNWTGFRMNLVTGEKRDLSGLFFREHIQFTGRGGELVKCGLTGQRSKHVTGDEILGARLAIVPEGNEPEKVLWQVGADSSRDLTVSLGRLHNTPPFVASFSGELFAIGIPRGRDEPHGWVWHLINRDGEIWSLPGKDDGNYISPYRLIGFAADDRLVIARKDSQIFTIPIRQP